MIDRRSAAGAAVAVAALALVVAALLATSRSAARSPRLQGLVPEVSAPGEVLTLHGRFFGDQRGAGAVTFAGREPSTDAYRSWSDERIEVTVPASLASGLVRVITRSGASDGRLLTHRDDLPMPVTGERRPDGTPVITAVTPAAGSVGQPITISGAGFGASPATGAVRFTAAAAGADAAASDSGSDPDPSAVVESAAVDLDHIRWSDRQIVVRVPAGAGSGAVSVRTAGGLSAAHDFQVRDAVGTIRYSDPRTYQATYAVTVAGVGSTGGNALFLWMPEVPATPAQRHTAAPTATLRPIYRDPSGVDLFQLRDLVSGGIYEVRRQYVVRRYAIETSIENANVRRYRTDSPFHARFVGADALVPAGGRLPAVAERAIRGYVNPLWRARLVFEYVVARLQPAGAGEARIAAAGTEPMEVVMTAIDERRAAAYEYAVTFSAIARAAGVPARPVAGYLIGADERAIPHYWAEFYLQDFGWVPVDPAADDGAVALPQAAADDPVESYFGNLDSHRIVLAKGVLDPASVARGTRVQRAEVTGLQTVHEEVAGELVRYRTRWQELTVADRSSGADRNRTGA